MHFSKMNTSYGGLVTAAYGGQRLAQPDYLGLRPSVLNRTWDVARDRVPSHIQGEPVDSPIPPVNGSAVPSQSELKPEKNRSLAAEDSSNTTNTSSTAAPQQNIIEYVTLWAVVLVGLVLVDYLYLRK